MNEEKSAQDQDRLCLGKEGMSAERREARHASW